MSERGFRASVDDAGNAVGEIGEGPTHVVLLGHIDTVPGEIAVRVDDGELVGRGAVDAKGPLAAFVAAATDPVAGVRVTVVGAVEEESPTSAGARYRATLAAPDWCVIGEPSGWDAVTVAYKGRLALKVALSRSARHGAAPGMTCSEEALALWSTIRAAAERRTREADGFARLDCRLEGMSGGASDGLVEVTLRDCPFRELLDDHRDLVCSIHRGLVEGMLGALEPPLSLEAFTPLTERAICRVQVREPRA